jgi:DNA polymerase
MAREIYGDKSITKKDKAKRQLGKVAVLGLGYGMGKDKFLATCQGFGMHIDTELAERSVYAFRSMFKEVPALWRRLEQEAMNQTGGYYRNDKYSDFLCYRLPSGRELRYYKAKVEDGELKYLSKEAGSKDLVWRGTYGGRLCENVIQAIARDVMADAMLNLHRAGFKLVLTVHDEIVVTTPKDGADTRRVEMERIMKTAPSWAKGLPLNVESEVSTKYKK